MNIENPCSDSSLAASGVMGKRRSEASLQRGRPMVNLRRPMTVVTSWGITDGVESVLVFIGVGEIEGGNKLFYGFRYLCSVVKAVGAEAVECFPIVGHPGRECGADVCIKFLIGHGCYKRTLGARG